MTTCYNKSRICVLFDSKKMCTKPSAEKHFNSTCVSFYVQTFLKKILIYRKLFFICYREEVLICTNLSWY